MAVEHHRLAVMQRGWAGWDTFSYAVARVKAQLVAEDDEATALRQENQELQVSHSQQHMPALMCQGPEGFFVCSSHLLRCDVPPTKHSSSARLVSLQPVKYHQALI